MLALAKRESRAGETVGAALSRLMVDRHERVDALARAQYVAEHAEERRRGRELDARRAAAGSGAGPYDVMVAYAKCHRREGETVEAAFDRLCASGDRVMVDLYELYSEW